MLKEALKIATAANKNYFVDTTNVSDDDIRERTYFLIEKRIEILKELDHDGLRMAMCLDHDFNQARQYASKSVDTSDITEPLNAYLSVVAHINNTFHALEKICSRWAMTER
jgi:hypothetical protein